MFDKDSCNKNVYGIIKSNPIKEIDNFVVSNIFLKIDDETASERNKYLYEQKVSENKKEKNYDKKICDLYLNGKFPLNGTTYSIGNIYVAYGVKDTKNIIYLVCPKIGNYDFLNKKTYELENTNLVRFVDTTLFIEMINSKLLLYNDENIISFDDKRIDELNNVINNWDFKTHKLVPELDIDDQVINTNNSLIIYDENNNNREYSLLAIYDDKYIIYKDVNNLSNDKNLYASKIILNNDIIKLESLSFDEWDLITNEYQKLLSK